MNCEAFEARLNDILDERQLPSEDEQLISHARTCAPCGTLLSASEIIAERCEHSPVAAAPAAMAHQVMAQLIVEKTRAQHAWRPRVAWIAAAAVLAGFIVVPAIALLMTLGGRGADNGANIADGNRPSGDHGSPLAAGGTNRGADDIADQRIADSTDDVRRSRLGPSPFSTGGNIALALSSFSPQMEGIQLPEIDDDQVSAVKPLADTINVLVEVIWHAIPGLRFRPIATPLESDMILHLA